jgi:signal transduction histidine kinase
MGQRLSRILRIVHPETNEPLPALTGTLPSDESLVQSTQSGLLLARDGQQTAVNGRAAPIRDPSGEISGLVVVFRDITEQVQAREALTQYASELEARNAELDAFSHTVAHDLKDPLSTIVGCAQMLEGYWPTMADKDRAKFLGLVSGMGQQACNIVDELLVLAGSRSAEVRTEPVHMASLVGRAKQRLIYRLREAQAELVLPEQWPIVLGYGPWVEEVWVNYISNAIKYGGQNPHIELGATVQPDGMVQFWVSDRGHGISEEDQDRLFMPFTQLGKVRARGYGLGLSIVRRIMEKLGGEVGVESTLGEGSTFYFSLQGAEMDDRYDGDLVELGDERPDPQRDPAVEKAVVR